MSFKNNLQFCYCLLLRNNNNTSFIADNCPYTCNDRSFEGGAFCKFCYIICDLKIH